MSFRYDDSHPQLLVVYTGEDHDFSDYTDFVQRWVSRFEGDKRFGVLMVNEPHEHEDEDEHEHEEEEAKLVRLLNDFRRDHRQQSIAKTAGFANAYDPDDPHLKTYLEKHDKGWEMLQVDADSRARYIFGTRGRNFYDVEEAKQWLIEQLDLPPLEFDDESKATTNQTGRIGLFYGSTTGVTEKIAFDIQSAWKQKTGEDLEPVNIGTLKNLSELLGYDHLILGIPTWNIGQLQDDWDIAFPQLDNLDFTGKQVALFGIGDQYGYPDNYLDAVGILGQKLRELGAELVGYCDTDTYEFAESRALENGKFIGLGIDEVHQRELSAERIEQWLSQIIQEFNIKSVRPA